MGRLYKTTAATPEEYMYQIPAELMSKALDFTESQVDDIYNKSDLFGKSVLGITNLMQDQEDVKRIQDYYGKKIEDVTKALGTDVTQWRKYRPAIQELGRELQQDFTTGEVGRIQANYKAAQEFEKMLAEKVKSKEINPQTAAQYRNYYMSNFQGTKYDRKTGLGNTFSGITPMKDIDLNERIGGYVEKAMADSRVTYNSQVGKYFITDSKDNIEEISEDKLLSIIMPKIMADTELTGTLSERQMIGAVKDVFTDGKLNAYELKDVVDEKGQPVLGKDGQPLQRVSYMDNILSRAIQGAVNNRKYTKIEQGITGKKANPYMTQAIDHAHSWNMQKDRQRHEVSMYTQERADKQKEKDMENSLKMIDQKIRAGKKDEANEMINALSGRYPIIVTRPQEPVFDAKDLTSYAVEYTQLATKGILDADEARRFKSLATLFGNAATKLNITPVLDAQGKVVVTPEEQLADVIALEQGNKIGLGQVVEKVHNSTVNMGGMPTMPRKYKEFEFNERGQRAKTWSDRLAKTASKNETALDVVTKQLVENSRQEGQPNIVLDPNNTFGKVGLNVFDQLVGTNNYNVYLPNSPHTDGKGNLKPSNATSQDLVKELTSGKKKMSEVLSNIEYKPEGNRGVYTGTIKEGNNAGQQIKIVLNNVSETMLPYFNDPKLMEDPAFRETAMYIDPVFASVADGVRKGLPYINKGIPQQIKIDNKVKYRIELGENGYRIVSPYTTLETIGPNKEPITAKDIPIIIRQLEQNNN